MVMSGLMEHSHSIIQHSLLLKCSTIIICHINSEGGKNHSTHFWGSHFGHLNLKHFPRSSLWLAIWEMFTAAPGFGALPQGSFCSCPVALLLQEHFFNFLLRGGLRPKCSWTFSMTLPPAIMEPNLRPKQPLYKKIGEIWTPFYSSQNILVHFCTCPVIPFTLGMPIRYGPKTSFGFFGPNRAPESKMTKHSHCPYKDL